MKMNLTTSEKNRGIVRFLLMSMLLCLLIHPAQAQDRVTVTGRLTDTSHAPLIGASVIEQGTTNGVTTDTEGNYQISVSGNATLGFSFIGYKPQSIAVLNRTVIDVTLEEDATMIGEVVAIGYGSQRKEDLSMAVTTVKLDEAAKSRASNLATILQGRMPGVTVQQTGDPMKPASFTIRGRGSKGNDDDPTSGDGVLVVVDGVPNAPYMMEDVETITVLKDAGATAADAVFTGPDGKKYRLPTEGELNLLLPMWTEEADRATVNKEKDGMYYPYWNDNSSTNTFPYVTVETPFTETIYLKNGTDNLPDETHPADPEYTLKGESQLKVGTQTEQIAYPADLVTNVYNIRPVYGLRFKGTNQYAAYRWETCKIASDPLERYLSIRIKALHPQDNATTIDDVADETFWQDGFIEFQFPASGYYSPENAGNPTPENITHRGVYGYCWVSSLWTGDSDSGARFLGFYLNDAHVGHSVPGSRFPLRLVKVSE